MGEDGKVLSGEVESSPGEEQTQDRCQMTMFTGARYCSMVTQWSPEDGVATLTMTAGGDPGADGAFVARRDRKWLGRFRRDGGARDTSGAKWALDASCTVWRV